ncbi:nucleolar protein 12-like [Zingiber officinale]|uniref:RRM domain-containing protein n=1 Tax=Zingiber officinale TaxID=94328 RepID=A0A8J5GHC6_ZINOF|nr:nucleolar protein 12-like [Zingiber officinale]KAG6507416.1 hypothetical protein ZIOFF_032759 [Zingiber officinale]
MGKKGKDPDQETGAVQSLSSSSSAAAAANPLRSNSYGEAPVDPPAPAQELGFAELSLGREDSAGGSSHARKRKIDEVSLTPASVPEKREKLGDGPEVECSRKKRKKRKRAEIEEQYAKRKYGNEEDSSEGERTAVVGKKRKAAYLNSSQLVESKEPFDDESELVRTVFVGNLPLKETTQKALLKEFAKYGEIDSIRIRSVPIIDSNATTKAAILEGKVNGVIHSAHAYIVFKDEQSAKAALSHNMTLFRGNHVRVDMACPPHKKLKGEAPLYERKRTVFVGNLPFDVKDEELYHLFYSTGESTTSNVEAVRVVRDPYTSLGKGIAYVLFRSRDAVGSVVSKKDWKMRDHILTVRRAKSLDATSASVALSKRKGREQERDGESDEMAPKTKQPAVVVRKVKELLKKRKQENRTPEANHAKKKARKHHV